MLAFSCSAAAPATIPTGVVSQRLVVDPGGRYAAIFGQPISDDYRKDGRISGPPTKLVVIDLEQHRIVNEAPVEGEIRNAFVDGQQVIWLPQNVNVIHRLEISKQEKIQERPLSFAVGSLFDLSGRELAIVVTKGKVAKIAVLDKATLELIKNHPLSAHSITANWIRHPLRNLGDGQLSVGLRVVNKEDGTDRCFASNMYFYPRLDRDPNSEPNPLQSPIQPSHGELYWRRYVRSSHVSKLGNRAMFGIGSKYWHISESLPILTTLQLDSKQGSVTFRVALKDLVYGRVVEELTFEHDVERGRRRLTSGIAVRTAGNRVVVTFDDNLIVETLPLQMLRKKKVLEPLRLLYPVIPLADVGRKLKLQLQALGGTAPYEFSVMNKVDGITVGGNGDTLELDLPALWHARLRVRPEDPWTGQDVLTWPGLGLNPKLGFDIPAGKFLVALPLQLKVGDASGQDDAIVVSVLAAAPIDGLKAAQAKIREAIDDVRQARKATLQASDGDSDAALEQRVERLEQQMRRIEAALDNLLRKANENAAEK